MRQEYVGILTAVDAEFERNRKLHGDRIRCGQGCTDCCHHRFQITATEAAHIGEGLIELQPHVRDLLRSNAMAYLEDTADRVRCPALDQDGKCSIYAHRPLICRRFGMPIYNPDKPDRILACELNFKSGEEIRDPDLIRIQTDIHERWGQLKDSARLTVAEAILVADS